MRISILALFLLCSCGEASDPSHNQLPVDPAEAARLKAQNDKDHARYAGIKYPACKTVWNGNRLTGCGRNVLKVALTSCRDTFGSGQAWIDEYTGDSWQTRAGRAARSVEQRLEDVRRSDGPYFSQSFAYAKGDGTNDIGNVVCLLSSDMRLTDII